MLPKQSSLGGAKALNRNAGKPVILSAASRTLATWRRDAPEVGERFYPLPDGREASNSEGEGNQTPESEDTDAWHDKAEEVLKRWRTRASLERDMSAHLQPVEAWPPFAEGTQASSSDADGMDESEDEETLYLEDECAYWHDIAIRARTREARLHQELDFLFEDDDDEPELVLQHPQEDVEDDDDDADEIDSVAEVQVKEDQDALDRLKQKALQQASEMAWFQMEIERLRKQLQDAARLEEEYDRQIRELKRAKQMYDNKDNIDSLNEEDVPEHYRVLQEELAEKERNKAHMLEMQEELERLMKQVEQLRQDEPEESTETIPARQASPHLPRSARSDEQPTNQADSTTGPADLGQPNQGVKAEQVMETAQDSLEESKQIDALESEAEGFGSEEEEDVTQSLSEAVFAVEASHHRRDSRDKHRATIIKNKLEATTQEDETHKDEKQKKRVDPDRTRKSEALSNGDVADAGRLTTKRDSSKAAERDSIKAVRFKEEHGPSSRSPRRASNTVQADHGGRLSSSRRRDSEEGGEPKDKDKDAVRDSSAGKSKGKELQNTPSRSSRLMVETAPHEDDSSSTPPTTLNAVEETGSRDGAAASEVARRATLLDALPGPRVETGRKSLVKTMGLNKSRDAMGLATVLRPFERTYQYRMAREGPGGAPTAPLQLRPKAPEKAMLVLAKCLVGFGESDADGRDEFAKSSRDDPAMQARREKKYRAFKRHLVKAGIMTEAEMAENPDWLRAIGLQDGNTGLQGPNRYAELLGGFGQGRGAELLGVFGQGQAAGLNRMQQFRDAATDATRSEQAEEDEEHEAGSSYVSTSSRSMHGEMSSQGLTREQRHMVMKLLDGQRTGALDLDDMSSSGDSGGEEFLQVRSLGARPSMMDRSTAAKSGLLGDPGHGRKSGILGVTAFSYGKRNQDTGMSRQFGHAKGELNKQGAKGPGPKSTHSLLRQLLKVAHGPRGPRGHALRKHGPGHSTLASLVPNADETRALDVYALQMQSRHLSRGSMLQVQGVRGGVLGTQGLQSSPLTPVMELIRKSLSTDHSKMDDRQQQAAAMNIFEQSGQGARRRELLMESAAVGAEESTQKPRRRNLGGQRQRRSSVADLRVLSQALQTTQREMFNARRFYGCHSIPPRQTAAAVKRLTTLLAEGSSAMPDSSEPGKTAASSEAQGRRRSSLSRRISMIMGQVMRPDLNMPQLDSMPSWRLDLEEGPRRGRRSRKDMELSRLLDLSQGGEHKQNADTVNARRKRHLKNRQLMETQSKLPSVADAIVSSAIQPKQNTVEPKKAEATANEKKTTTQETSMAEGRRSIRRASTTSLDQEALYDPSQPVITRSRPSDWRVAVNKKTWHQDDEFKDVRSFMSQMGELDIVNEIPGQNEGDVNKQAGGVSLYHSMATSYSSDEADVKEPAGRTILTKIRQSMLDRHGNYAEAYKAIATGRGNRVTRGDLANEICLISDDKTTIDASDEVDTLFDYFATLRGAQLSVARDVTKHDFMAVMRSAEPIDSLADFRDRLGQKYARLHMAFEEYSEKQDKQLGMSEFQHLCAAVGGTPEAAKHIFQQMVEHNPRPHHSVSAASGHTRQQRVLSEEAFITSLRHAEGLDAVRSLRQTVSGSNRELLKEFAAIDQEHFEVPLDMEEFCSALAPLATSKGCNKHLFALAFVQDGASAANSTVWLEDVVLRIFGGFGYRHRRLVKALRRDRNTSAGTFIEQLAHALAHVLARDRQDEEHARHDEGTSANEGSQTLQRFGRFQGLRVDTSRGTLTEAPLNQINEATGSRSHFGRRRSSMSSRRSSVASFVKELGPEDRGQKHLQKLSQKPLFRTRLRAFEVLCSGGTVGPRDQLAADDFVKLISGTLRLPREACLDIFLAVDAVGRDTLSLAEFVGAVRAARPIRTVAHLQSFLRSQAASPDASGFFLSGTSAPLSSRSARSRMLDAFTASAESLDRPLDKDRWVSSLEELGVPRSDARHLFKVVDVDGDGVVSGDEVTAALVKPQPVYDDPPLVTKRLRQLKRALEKRGAELSTAFAARPQNEEMKPQDIRHVFLDAGFSPNDAWHFLLLMTWQSHAKTIPLDDVKSTIQRMREGDIRNMWHSYRPLRKTLKAKSRKRTLINPEVEEHRFEKHQDDDESQPYAELRNEAEHPLGDASNLITAPPLLLDAKELIEEEPDEVAETDAAPEPARLVRASEMFRQTSDESEDPVHSDKPIATARTGQRPSSLRRTIVGQDLGELSGTSVSSNSSSQKSFPKRVKKIMMLQKFTDAGNFDGPKMSSSSRSSVAKRTPSKLSSSPYADRGSVLRSKTGPSRRLKEFNTLNLSEAEETDQTSEHAIEEELCLPLTSEDLNARAEAESTLAGRRHDAFDTVVNHQVALHRLHELRYKLFAKMKLLGGAWKLLCKNRRGVAERTTDSLDLADFQAAVTSKQLSFAALDTERMFKMLELVEGRSPFTFGDFVIAMRFTAPTSSLLDIRKCLVQRYCSARLALSSIGRGQVFSRRKTDLRDEDFSVDELERRLLCGIGAVDAAVRWVFRILDPCQTAHLRWEDVEFAVEHADAYSQLEGLHSALLRGSRSLEAGLVRTGVVTSAEPACLAAVLSGEHLEHIGLPSCSADQVLTVLRRQCAKEEVPTIETLLRQLRTFDGGAPHRTASGCDFEDLTEPTSPKMNSGAHLAVGVPESLVIATILSWRKLRAVLLRRYPQGAAEAFEHMDTQGTGAIDLTEWIHQVKWALSLLNESEHCEETAANLFGIMVGWKHSRWAPGIRTNPTISTADLAKALRLSAPAWSLKQLRTRFLDEFDTLSKAFEHIGAGDEVSVDTWCRSLQQGLWITPAEAAQHFALFDLGSDGLLSQGAFMKNLRHPDAVMCFHGLCIQLAQQHGLVSRAFEALPLSLVLSEKAFQQTLGQLWGVSGTDSKVMYMHLWPDPHSAQAGGAPPQVSLATLLDVLTTMEDRHYFFLVPFQKMGEHHDDLPEHVEAVQAVDTSTQSARLRKRSYSIVAVKMDGLENSDASEPASPGLHGSRPLRDRSRAGPRHTQHFHSEKSTHSERSAAHLSERSMNYLSERSSSPDLQERFKDRQAVPVLSQVELKDISAPQTDAAEPQSPRAFGGGSRKVRTLKSILSSPGSEKASPGRGVSLPPLSQGGNVSQTTPPAAKQHQGDSKRTTILPDVSERPDIVESERMARAEEWARRSGARLNDLRTPREDRSSILAKVQHDLGLEKGRSSELGAGLPNSPSLANGNSPRKSAPMLSRKFSSARRQLLS